LKESLLIATNRISAAGLLSKYRKRQKFGGTLVWRIWQIKEIHQTLIRQLAFFVLFIIGCTVNSPNFLPPTCFERQFA